MDVTTFSESKSVSDKVLDEMLRCNTVCSDIGTFKKTEYKVEEDFIEWLYCNLPSMSYVVDRIINFIFSNGLTTGDELQDEKLDAFLYAQNIQGTTNLNALREGIKQALVFGKSGLRWLGDDGIMNINSKYYACLTQENETHYGFKEIIGFIVSFKGQKIWDMDVTEIDFDEETFESQGIIIDKGRGLLILSQDEFLNLRNNTSKNNGESPLKYDQQRLKLISAIYERLNYDIVYDGPGRLLLRVSKDYMSSDQASGNGQLLDNTQGGRDRRADEVKKEVSNIGEQIKKSTSDNVIAVSDYFDKDITHLPRVTKATEFFNWLSGEGEMIAQLFGISPTLLGLGKISGNVSMEKIIDNSMLNDIIPLREMFAVQISAWLADKLGVDKIYFDMYEMKQVVDENDTRAKVVKQAIEIRRYGSDADQAVADDLMAMVDADLDTGKGELKTLATKHGVFKRILKAITNKEE